MRSRDHARIDCLPGSDVLGNAGAAAGRPRHQPHHAARASEPKTGFWRTSIFAWLCAPTI